MTGRAALRQPFLRIVAKPHAPGLEPLEPDTGPLEFQAQDTKAQQDHQEPRTGNKRHGQDDTDGDHDATGDRYSYTPPEANGMRHGTG